MKKGNLLALIIAILAIGCKKETIIINNPPVIVTPVVPPVVVPPVDSIIRIVDTAYLHSDIWATDASATVYYVPQSQIPGYPSNLRFGANTTAIEFKFELTIHTKPGINFSPSQVPQIVYPNNSYTPYSNGMELLSYGTDVNGFWKKVRVKVMAIRDGSATVPKATMSAIIEYLYYQDLSNQSQRFAVNLQSRPVTF